jgi:Protein of unknown function (DUF3105)
VVTVRVVIAALSSAERERPVANKAKSSKGTERDRRARVEALRQEQLAKERRKSTIIVVIAVIVGLGIVLAAALPAYLSKRNDPAKKSLSSFGVTAAAASCSSVATTKGTNTDALRTHVADGTVEKYKTVPPSYGPHWATPVINSRSFYSVKDRPQMEDLVHNLEHGYTIVWYDDTIKGAQLTALKNLSSSARARNETAPSKFIVSAWDDAYGNFPAGKHLGISHWGAATSHTQLCGKVSGQVVSNFIKKYPATDSPEPSAA